MTTNNLLIHQAGVQDIPAIVSVAEATWEPTYRDIVDPAQIAYMFSEIYNPDALRRQMEEQGHTFLLLLNDEKPLAFASFSPRPEEATTFKLHKIYLHPDQHGKGLGRILLDEVIRQATERGGKWLDLNVNRNNPARFFYEKCGFQIIREEDIPIGEFWMNDYVLSRPLG